MQYFPWQIRIPFSCLRMNTMREQLLHPIVNLTRFTLQDVKWKDFFASCRGRRKASTPGETFTRASIQWNQLPAFAILWEGFGYGWRMRWSRYMQLISTTAMKLLRWRRWREEEGKMRGCEQVGREKLDDWNELHVFRVTWIQHFWHDHFRENIFIFHRTNHQYTGKRFTKTYEMPVCSHCLSRPLGKLSFLYCSPPTAKKYPWTIRFFPRIFSTGTKPNSLEDEQLLLPGVRYYLRSIYCRISSVTSISSRLRYIISKNAKIGFPDFHHRCKKLHLVNLVACTSYTMRIR